MLVRHFLLVEDSSRGFLVLLAKWQVERLKFMRKLPNSVACFLDFAVKLPDIQKNIFYSSDSPCPALCPAPAWHLKLRDVSPFRADIISSQLGRRPIAVS